jgi:hypothetical protein
LREECKLEIFESSLGGGVWNEKRWSMGRRENLYT